MREPFDPDGVDVRADKRFKIFRDLDKRKTELENHAVRLVLEEGSADPNLPMIPQVERAHYRMVCYECQDAFWSTGGRPYCPICWGVQQEIADLNKEVQRLRNKRALHTLREEVRHLEEEVEL